MYSDPRSTDPSRAFDLWLTNAIEEPGPIRAGLLANWAAAPSARYSHPREEHLIPLMVAAGTSEAPGKRIYNELVLKTAISGFGFE